MLKHITVPIIIDDHEPEKCKRACKFFDFMGDYCIAFGIYVVESNRCKQCLEEAK